MANTWKLLLREEVAQLRDLRELLNEERACLSRTDPVGLMELARKKEAAAARVRLLASHKTKHPAPCTGPETGGLLQERASLLEALRAQSRIHSEILEEERTRLGQLLAFLQGLRSDRSTYDRSGKLR